MKVDLSDQSPIAAAAARALEQTEAAEEQERGASEVGDEASPLPGTTSVEPTSSQTGAAPGGELAAGAAAGGVEGAESGGEDVLEDVQQESKRRHIRATPSRYEELLVR